MNETICLEKTLEAFSAYLNEKDEKILQFNVMHTILRIFLSG